MALPRIEVIEEEMMSRWPSYDSSFSSGPFGEQVFQGAALLHQDEWYDHRKTQDMDSMQRFFQEKGPFTPESVLAHQDAMRLPYPFNAQFDRQLEIQPSWPYLERYHSPDGSASSRSGFSASHRSEDAPAYRYGLPSSDESPLLANVQKLGIVEPQTYATFSTSHELLPHGGGIALCEIQDYPDEEPEVDTMETEAEFGWQDSQSECYPIKVEGGRYEYQHEDEGLGDSIGDADSDAPPGKEEASEDSDYEPTPSSPSTKRRRRNLSNASNTSTRSSGRRTSRPRRASAATTSPTTNTANTRVSKSRSKNKQASAPPTSASSASGSNKSGGRPFPCPFAIYGCTSTFSSKNEWKRHISTQHVRLGFWRCDLCQPTYGGGDTETPCFNDFNRKDLFTQHLRRMHTPPSSSTTAPTSSAGGGNGNGARAGAGTSSGSGGTLTEREITAHQQRCYRTLRPPPPTSSCLFCTQKFSGPGSWDERVEHVGRHMEEGRKGKGTADPETWREDKVLQAWLVKEGLVVKERGGGWLVGDGVPRRDEREEDRDAEGEEAEA